MPKFWSTAQAPPRDRLAYWVDAVCDSLVHADCVARRNRSFFGEMRIDAAASLRVVAIAGTAQLTI
jgi:hypothetical protein